MRQSGWMSGGIESRHAWVRLAASLALSTIGSVGMWSVVVVLPAVQAEFGTDRATASLPYTSIMLGFVAGGVLMGRLADRRGVVLPVLVGTASLGLGYAVTAASSSMLVFALASGAFIGLTGASAVFSPLVADISR